MFTLKRKLADCCVLLSSCPLAAKHAESSFHHCAAQETLPKLKVSLITKNSHVSGQRLNGVTGDEEKYLLSLRDYEKKSLENFLKLAHSCQMAKFLQTSTRVEEPQAQPGIILSCAITAAT